MNVLILTGKFGMGHISAAEAVKQEILMSEPDANIKIIDMIEYIFPTSYKAIYSGFNFMVNKCSHIYNFLNHISCKYSGVPLNNIIKSKINLLIKSNNTDFIVSTLPICTRFISAYKETTGNIIPLYTYITDITPHEEWISPMCNLYFVGSNFTKKVLISKGVHTRKIIVCGIPVKQNFKNIVRIDNFSKNKEILIMGGGLGLIPSSDQLLNELIKVKNLNITIITGKNMKLFNAIKAKYPQINVISYTDKVSEYMAKADLVITKSGGITVFEAIHSQTPMYIIKPFLMQEIGNAKFVENFNLGKVSWNKNSDIHEEIIALINDAKELNYMKNNMKERKRCLESCSPVNYYYDTQDNLCS